MNPYSHARLLLLVAAAAVGLCYACANLPPVSADVCGNRVVDANEDCDTYDVGRAKCGAPGTTTQCRLLCAASADCPSGWGCGVDGVCRAPSGTFDVTFDPIASGQARLQTGDFDGDGRQDILASSVSDLGRAQIHYVDGSGQIAQTLDVGAVMRSPFVTRTRAIDDGLDDIAFASSSGGVDMLLGQTDRTVLPVAYPTALPTGFDVSLFGLAGAFATNTVPIASDGSAGLSVVVGTAPVVGTVVDGVFFGQTPVPLRVPADLGLRGRADIVDGLVAKILPGSVCGELVLLATPKSGSPELDLIPVCRKDATGAVGFNDTKGDAATAPKPVRVDLGVLVTRGVAPLSLAIGDMNHDGQPDVVVNTAPSPSGAEVGPYLFDPSPTGGLSSFTYALRGASAANAVNIAPILTTADFNGDGYTDIVTPTDLCLSLGATGAVPLFASVAHNLGDAWNEAVAVDMNRDGNPDVAAISPSRTAVDFYVGSKAGLFSAGSLSTSGVASRLASSDYDGDGVNDLAILARTSSDAAGGDVLVAYGRVQGLPESPALVASFALANDLASLPASPAVLAVNGNQPGDANDPALTELALLVGDADRVPLSVKPLQFPDSPSAFAVLAGPLAAAGEDDVGVLYGSSSGVKQNGAGYAFATETKAASASFAGDLGDFVSIAPEGESSVKGIVLGAAATTSSAKANEYLANTNVPIAVGDLDGDGVSEAYVVSGNVGGTTARIAKLVSGGASPGVVDFVAAPQGFGVGGKLQIVDVDGDGARDLVYVSGFQKVSPSRGPGQGTTIDGTSTMTVYFNDGKGTLSPSGVALTGLAVTLPAEVLDAGDAGASSCATFANPTAIASVRADKSGASRVAIITAKCLYLATVSRSGAGQATSLLSRDLTVGFSLVAADMTGDGVDDLAFLDDRSLSVLRGLPVLP